MNDLQAILAELREAVRPSGILGRVDVGECLALIDEAERRLPDVVRRANEVVRAEAEILERAKRRAESVLAEAEKKAERIASDSAVLHRAQKHADQAEADGRRLAADTLNSLAEYLDTLARRTKENARAIVKPVRVDRERYPSFRD